MSADPKADALRQLDAVRAWLRTAPTLASILDDGWLNAVEAEIRATGESGVITTDGAGILLTLGHPLRGVEWFERDQNLLLADRRSEIDPDGQLVLAMVGADPLRTLAPLLEARLAHLRAMPFKRPVIEAKFAQLRATRSDRSFRNHLFEASVLGDLALKGVLTDVEDGATGVDGAIDLDGRDILVEATNTTQDILPDFTGVFFVDPDREITQVVKKVRKKVADGRQIARAQGKPALLFLALTRRGADAESARIAIHESFGDPAFSALSGVVVADSWRFQRTEWYPGPNPDTPLNEREAAKVRAWYGSA